MFAYLNFVQALVEAELNVCVRTPDSVSKMSSQIFAQIQSRPKTKKEEKKSLASFTSDGMID